MNQLDEFQNNIKYHFNDTQLLKQALTHSSYANELHLSKLSSNERLEFLGDAILELVISENIYKKHTKMSEGELTKLRASIVCEQTLAYSAKELHLGDYLFLGKGEDATGGRNRDSILSDAFEAVIGSIYLDGSFTSAKEFINRALLSDMENKKLFFDSKTILQEIVQSDYKKHLHYKLLDEAGPDHNKKFTVVAMMDGEQLEQGTGKTKKSAEQDAAYRSILILKSNGTTHSKETLNNNLQI